MTLLPTTGSLRAGAALGQTRTVHSVYCSPGFIGDYQALAVNAPVGSGLWNGQQDGRLEIVGSAESAGGRASTSRRAWSGLVVWSPTALR